ncbi:MAG: LCP family protein [Coriobacteriia bacterium]
MARRRKHVALGCGITLLIGIIALVVYGSIWIGGLNKRMADSRTISPEVTEALEAAEPERAADPFYILIMGVDARVPGEDSRSDTLIVARIDPPQKRVTLLSIPRDTRVEVPGHGKTKINAAHAYGGPALAIETVTELTGLPISHYAEIDFSGFKEIVEALGGVTVDVPEDIYDLKAANHVEEAARLEAGVQRLDGAHALTFVRSRQFPEGDLQRIRNQQTFFKAVLAEMQKPANLLRLPSAIEAAADSMYTDMSVGQMLRIANQMKGMAPEDLETVTMPGVPEMIAGGSYIVIDEEAFTVMLDRMKAGERAVPLVVEEEAPALDPADVTVTVRNGAGIEGVANSAAGILAGAGFAVGEVGNADQFVYDETLVVYGGDDSSAADLVVSTLDRGRVVQSRGMYSFSTDILVVVGKDWNSSQAADQ